jgi:serine/threonine-protein kinase
MQVTTANSQTDRAFGKYRLNRLLGKGGMGEVYEAYDTQKDRAVAVKILAQQYSHDDRFRTRFQRESHAAAILQEPHVIPIHDWGEIDGNLYIDMRLVTGHTLHDLLKRGPLQPERAVAIINQIAAALDAAHAEGLIHRDVKPQNIIVTPADFAYLLDFGIAEAKGDTHLTVAGHQIGSFDYMSPERFGDQLTTPAADVYSLACVLHQALTGNPPFPRRSLEQAMAAHVASPPPRPSAINPRVPVSFDHVVARGMAKEPDERYGSAGALGRAAQRALRENGVSQSQADTWEARPSRPAASPTAVPRPADTRERGLWVLPAVIATTSALLVGAIGVVIGLLLNQKSGSDEPPRSTAHPPQTTYAVPVPTAIETRPPYTPSQTVPPPSTAVTVPADPETASVQRLRHIADSDRPFVRAALADHWVPQLSSKRPGVVDDGVVWDNAKTLQEHLQLRQRYPGARLLWSGDWSTFSAPNFWVTVVGITFPNSSGALAWCRGQGFDEDHCIAKVVSTTSEAEGSTAYN